MATQPIWTRIQDTFKTSGLAPVFLRVLGWQAPASQPLSNVTIGAVTWQSEVIAELPGAAIVDVPDLIFTTPEEHRKLARIIANYYPEHIVRFLGETRDTWYWPRRLLSGGMSLEAFTVGKGFLPDFLAQRLAGLQFTAKDYADGLSAATVRDRLRGTIETAKITSDFYKKFKVEHENLTSAISGVPKEAAHGYATLLLNRLMFIWFLQKKQFLNNDVNYLQTCLSRIQALNGQGNFYNFYKDYLLDLFFNYLNAKDRDNSADLFSEIIGDIPYVNGGIFGQSDVEREFNEIYVPDEAFESIFSFFSAFTWHLDTRPTGDPTEINPEVIGYIFEQYINYTADGKKDSGAYYTQSDVTGYMASQTVIPAVLDSLGKIGYNFLGDLALAPVSYINETLLHGSTHTGSKIEWVPVDDELVSIWNSDPLNWHVLDNAEFDPKVQLEDETWVETFARRARIDELAIQLTEGKALTVNDLVTLNVNSSKLLLDTISEVDSVSESVEIFETLSKLSVLDPTCGSGAFLFAALGVIEPIYQLLFERFDVLGIPENVPEVANIAKAENRSYAIRKHIALANLHGTDIMPDAIETAKLRIFLALAATLTDRSELEPLPDLDFNLRCGNLVVGFADAQDSARMGGGDILLEAEIRALQPRIDNFQGLVADFQNRQKHGDPAQDLKVEISREGRYISEELSAMYASAIGIDHHNYQEWLKSTKPFHWVLEFPEVINRGGFDVIIGNPPYIRMNSVPSRDIVGYSTRVSPDFYAVCYERSLRLLAPGGRHAFLVMLSLSFSDRFKKLREHLSAIGFSEWWSTYGARPLQLFPEAKVRNTMLLLGPGDSKHSTRHHIMTSGTRKWQFDAMEYFEMSRPGDSPAVRGGVANDLARQLLANHLLGRKSGEVLRFRGTGAYWFPVFFHAPPAMDANFQVISEDDGLSKTIDLTDVENSLVSAGALAGKISYFIWQATGDDFHVLESQTTGLRALASKFASDDLFELARSLESASRDKHFISNNAGKYYLGIRWNQLRDVTDKFDRQLLENAGLLDHWRPLNIWYRQTMRATRENLNSTSVPRHVIDEIWPPTGASKSN